MSNEYWYNENRKERIQDLKEQLAAIPKQREVLKSMMKDLETLETAIKIDLEDLEKKRDEYERSGT